MRKTAIGAAAVLALALAPGSALAQDDMSDDDMMMGTMVPHPSHIHSGDCSMPGEVIVGLQDVGVVGNDAQGAASHVHVDIGRSTVDKPLADFLASDHSIMVHQSAEDPGTILSCGSIGGHDVDGSFLVGMGPVGDSGYSGIAWLTDNGDGTTGVQVTISHSGATEGMGMHDMDDDMSGDDMDDDMSGDDMSGDDMSGDMDDDMDSDDGMSDDDDMDSDS